MRRLLMYVSVPEAGWRTTQPGVMRCLELLSSPARAAVRPGAGGRDAHKQPGWSIGGLQAEREVGGVRAHEELVEAPEREHDCADQDLVEAAGVVGKLGVGVSASGWLLRTASK